MNEKIKKFFSSIGIFFTGIMSTLLCVLGIKIHNNRNAIKTAGRKQSSIEDRIESNESIFAEIRKTKQDN